MAETGSFLSATLHRFSIEIKGNWMEVQIKANSTFGVPFGFFKHIIRTECEVK